MALVKPPRQSRRGLRTGRKLLALCAALVLGACAQLPTPGVPDALTLDDKPAQAKPKDAAQSKDELVKATEYWGKKYAAKTTDLQAALNYARNLKAMGEKQRALAVLQQASIFHGANRELAGEYGRLALDFDQVSIATRLLAAADDPVHPDWRIVSARGAALAKQGKYRDAIPFFERALTLAPDQPSVLSNLALAKAMSGEADEAEALLRRASATDANSSRIRQNLALVLGLQGKYDEAKAVSSRDMPIENAAENTDYLRQIVKLEPKVSGEAAVKIADAAAEKVRAQAIAEAAKTSAKAEAVAQGTPEPKWAAAEVKAAPVKNEAAPIKPEKVAAGVPAAPESDADEVLPWATHLKTAAAPASKTSVPPMLSASAEKTAAWTLELSAAAGDENAKRAGLGQIELPVRKPRAAAGAETGKETPKPRPAPKLAQEKDEATPSWASKVAAGDRDPTWTPQVALSTSPGTEP